jgi:mannose-6-phosphate isomerase-like protein (cupin superfamily)
MKIKLDKTDSDVVKSNETYDVIDNLNLKELIVSKTILHEGKETSGHNHKGQEEVYIFTEGHGAMQVGEEKFLVSKGDIVLIPDGEFHKVWNTSVYKANNPLIFICIFNGGRNH